MATLQQISDTVSACAALVTSMQTAITGLQATLSQAGTVIPATVQAQIDAVSGQVDAHQAALTGLVASVNALPKV